VPFWHSIGDCGPGSLERRSVRYGEVRTGKAMAASSMLQACFKHAATLADFEGGKRRPYSRTLADLRRAFEAAGVEFIIDGLHLTFVTRGAAEPTHSSKPMGGNPGPLQWKDTPASSLRSPGRQVGGALDSSRKVSVWWGTRPTSTGTVIPPFGWTRCGPSHQGASKKTPPHSAKYMISRRFSGGSDGARTRDL
jgi:hypothetical protein